MRFKLYFLTLSLLSLIISSTQSCFNKESSDSNVKNVENTITYPKDYDTMT